MQNGLFKKSSVERFSSPEKLNDYIQVANPSAWMVLTAALALLLGVLIWGVFGELTQSEHFCGVAQDDVLRCYVDSAVASQLEPGMPVDVMPMSGEENPEKIQGSIRAVADHPLSFAEASAGVDSDYLMEALGISTWNIVVEVSVDEPLYEGVVYAVAAVTDTQRPIDLVFQ